MARITNLHRRFHSLAEVRQVSDPWGDGIIFHVRRSGVAGWREAQSRLAAKNPLMGRMLGMMLERATSAKNGAPQTAPVLDESEMLSALDSQSAEEEVAGAIFDHLLAPPGWEGLTSDDGDVVPFNRDEAIALFTDREFWVPEFAVDENGEIERDEKGEPVPIPYGGCHFGEAVRNFIVHQADDVESFYQGLEGGLRKNSERSCAGESNGLRADGSSTGPQPPRSELASS